MNRYEEYESVLSRDLINIYGMPAEESLSDVIAAAEKVTNKLSKTAIDGLLSIGESVAANIIVFSKNLEGYRMHRISGTLINKILDIFEEIIKNSTYNYERLFRGMTRKEAEQGVQIFNASPITSMQTNMNLISAAVKMHEKHKELVSKGYFKKDDFLSYQETVKVQKRMLNLSIMVRTNMKKWKANLISRIRANDVGMGSHVDTLLNLNKKEIAQMGSIIISAMGDLYIKPNTSIAEDHPEASRAIERMGKDVNNFLLVADQYTQKAGV